MIIVTRQVQIEITIINEANIRSNHKLVAGSIKIEKDKKALWSYEDNSTDKVLRKIRARMKHIITIRKRQLKFLGP